MQRVRQAMRSGRKSWPEYKQLEELITRGIIDEQGLQIAHSIMGMTDLRCEQMLARTIVTEKGWEVAAMVLGRKAGNKVLRVQGSEVKPQEGCDNLQYRDKKMDEDQTYESRAQRKEVKPKVVKWLHAQSSAKQGKSLPTKSRVQGKEVQPQEGCGNFQYRDKKNGGSRRMAEDQTCEFSVESRVQGKEAKPEC